MGLRGHRPPARPLQALREGASRARQEAAGSARAPVLRARPRQVHSGHRGSRRGARGGGGQARGDVVVTALINISKCFDMVD
eukprot:7851923-Pyramimonas_sp.AAC.1